MNLRYTLLIALFSATISYAQNEFITVWETTTDNESITIPTFTGETYNYTVDWGDGTVESGQTGAATHTYATAGTYDVTITGTFPRIYFNDTGDSEKILAVKQWGNQAWTSMEGAFFGCSKLNITATDVPDLTAVSSMKNMFNNALLETANKIGEWDTSTVTNMRDAFLSSNFNQPIGNWDVSSVTNMAGMFYFNAHFNQDISGWDTSAVTDMRFMFYAATAFNQDISGWDTSAVTNMFGMFGEAAAFNQDLSNWDTSSVTNMDSMFGEAAAFNQDLSNWDIGAVTDMTEMFTGVRLSTANYDSMLDSWSKQAVQSNVTFGGGGSKYCVVGEAGRAVLASKGWTITDLGKDTSAVCNTLAFITVWKTTAAGESITIPTFTGETYNYTVDWGDGSTTDSGQTGAATHTYATAGSYDVSITGTFPRIYFNATGDKTKILEVKQWGNQAWTSMEKAFSGCSKLNITATDVPDLTNLSSMRNMFNNALLETANKIGEWDTSTVTDMGWMFVGTRAFNQDISSWNTSMVTTMEAMFVGASNFNQDIGSWNTSRVSTMEAMFDSAAAFNQDISRWDTGAVNDMANMFSYTSTFNQNISSWNTSAVTDMGYMFDSAAAFNQDISSWDTSAVNDMANMFSYASTFNQDLSNWDISAATNMSGIFNGVTLSTANYDSMLDSWSKKTVQRDVSFSGGNSKYCDLGEAGRAVLEGKGWGFTDGGKDNETICGTLDTSVSAYSPWAIYPNPVKNRVYVSGSTVPKRIEVFGIDGKKLLDESDVDNVGVDQLNNGMYLVKLSASNGSSQVFKLIKE